MYLTYVMTWLLLAIIMPVLAVSHTNSIEEFERMNEAQAFITEQQLLQEEQTRIQAEKEKDLNETMTEWFITRMEWLGRINYRLGHFSEAENKFDCSWLFKAYAVRRGLLSEEEAGYVNSTVLYLLATPKKLSQAKRWDITYRSPLWDETLKHLAVITRDYNPSEWVIWIIDNAPWNWWKVEESFNP